MNERKKKKKVEITSKCYANLTVSFNNTIATITNLFGKVIAWSSAGRVGFKGSRKGTRHAATMTCQSVAAKAASEGVKDVTVRIKGVGPNKIDAVNALSALNVVGIEDRTGKKYNGCRPPKRRKT